MARGCGMLLALIVLVVAVFWVGWGTPVGPLGPVLAYPFFTHPPRSVDKPPLLPDARQVKEVHTSNPDRKAITYDTQLAPDEVYKFYRDALTKDGWGRKFAYPQPTPASDEVVLLEWDQAGPNGCEEFGYTFRVDATKATSTSTSVQLEIVQINPC
jgi:hypothetical protein